MDRDMSEPREGRRRPLLSFADQVTVAALVTSCFVAILLHWIWHVASGTDLIAIDQAPPQELSFQIQLNEADWPELTLLPKIGETLARRIVEYRETHGPFQSIEQLQNVKGIGPKTIRRVESFLVVGETSPRNPAGP